MNEFFGLRHTPHCYLSGFSVFSGFNRSKPSFTRRHRGVVIRHDCLALVLLAQPPCLVGHVHCIASCFEVGVHRLGPCRVEVALIVAGVWPQGHDDLGQRASHDEAFFTASRHRRHTVALPLCAGQGSHVNQVRQAVDVLGIRIDACDLRDFTESHLTTPSVRRRAGRRGHLASSWARAWPRAPHRAAPARHAGSGTRPGRTRW